MGGPEYMQTQRIKILGKDAIPTNNSSSKTDLSEVFVFGKGIRFIALERPSRHTIN